MKTYWEKQLVIGGLVVIAGLTANAGSRLADASSQRVWQNARELPNRPPGIHPRSRPVRVRASDPAQALPRSEGAAFGNSNLNPTVPSQKAIETVIRF